MKKRVTYMILSPADVAIFTSKKRNEVIEYFVKNCDPSKYYIQECYY